MEVNCDGVVLASEQKIGFRLHFDPSSPSTGWSMFARLQVY